MASEPVSDLARQHCASATHHGQLALRRSRLGIAWRRNLPFLLAVSAPIGFGFGIFSRDWSSLRSPAHFWRNIIYSTLTLGGYSFGAPS